ncbi:two-component system sensor histidine kinase KdpD [Duganella violaceipulchra]|uniref:histidine kinase n=1 Tax=Duganella violaceipulchra TaxID=2849652 RepID=A0AA41L3V9_9BURK|nr:two-component system sensor histidine kinase KdpD [Duganella violaceicalia]MBV6320232.1 two-component system sensor histidine kinase KdpD [Duganella violaceicalia]MCP2011681.1 two-component system sensor histidine kinase KdpD [Duganella violaceicalia]
MFPNDKERPDPDALLAQVQAQERKAARGKLRIYFGASAGVGKTYAMLAAARKLQADGQPVLVGVIETHGRSETAAMLEGLDVLPLRQVAHRGKQLAEFDIDGALARRPPLILMDELAHSNAPGSRHPKRWQDVEELLDAGIDVLTTVNVQHLESLNDVVGGITGIRVGETVPDTVFDQADEVVLVDIPADELLARLKSGKVYKEQQAERASRNFFRKGNLIALRELALRRTADRIEDDVRAYRVEQSIGDIWKTGAALLACVGPRPGGEHTVRGTARLASQLGTGWHAIYIETPSLQRLPAGQRERILKTLKLAEDLGATTAVVSGHDIARAAVEYARSHNLSKIVLGRAHPGWPWRAPHIKRLARYGPDIDLVEIGAPSKEAAPAGRADAASAASAADAGPDGEPDPAQARRRLLGYVAASGASVATALLATPLLAYLDLANIAMLFLLVVVLVAVRFGRGPSVLATCVSVACFDFFFVPPRFTFAVSDFQYLITFVVMLAVGLITGHLTADLRFQARVASHREKRSRALYEFARELSGALQTEQIFETTQGFIQRAFHVRATLLVPDDAGRLLPPAAAPREADAGARSHRMALDTGVAQWAFDRAESAGLGTDTLPASRIFYLPLVAPMRTRGVLAIEPEQRRWILIPEQRQQLDTFAALAAIALERVHYIEVAQNALVNMESERLRNSLLAALSHDLRTPLTSLVGLSETLAGSKPALAPAQLEVAALLHDEALRMSALVSNLLDMARIQSGEVKFNLQWQALEEVVGSALRASASLLQGHTLRTRLPPTLPLLSYDAVLIERVLCNLLENAAKYTPPGSRIEIAAALRGAWIDVMVYDDGPGLPHGREEAVFEKFTRGERESAKPGVGLGLAICRAIVEAHGGHIHAAASPLGGAAFVMTLPLGTPPAMPEPETEGSL